MKAAKEAAERICGGTEMHVVRTTKVIERACLEAQLEVLNEISQSQFTYDSLCREKEQIEAKLKAMK